MKLLLICAILATGCSAAVAQDGSAAMRGQGTRTDPMIERMGSDPVYNRSVTGTVLSIDGARRLLMIERADRSQLTFVVDPKVRVRADKDTPMAGRKDLSLSDYKPGQVVRVSYRVEDNRAVEIRLKRPKS